VRAERCLGYLHSDLRCIVVDMDKVGSVRQYNCWCWKVQPVLDALLSKTKLKTCQGSNIDIIAKLARIRVRRQTFQCVRDAQLSYLIFDELN
jgi:hypothetical protein